MLQFYLLYLHTDNVPSKQTDLICMHAYILKIYVLYADSQIFIKLLNFVTQFGEVNKVNIFYGTPKQKYLFDFKTMKYRRSMYQE